MEIINKKISELKPYENNPRFNDEAVEYVANSIKEFGFKVPMVIDKNNVIVAGHTRYKASLELGLEEVPTIVADDLTEEQIKAFRLADNKVSEKAGWNFELLDEELEDILNIDMQKAYEMLLGQNIIFVIGSLTAYFMSQTWDVWFFHKIRNKFLNKDKKNTKKRWIWNNASTMTSQIIDTVVFIGIAFGLGFGWLWNNPVGLLNMFIGQYLIKFILAMCDTPIFYLLTRKK